jgi:cell wall-associated NlpC family hydrolase
MNEALRQAANQIIGTPYKPGGRDRMRGIDCVGLVLILADEGFGIQLPDPQTWNEAELEASDFYAAFELLPKGELLQEGDVMCRYNLRRAGSGHIGMVVGRNVVHMHDKVGAIRTPLSAFPEYPFYRIKELCSA